MSLTPPLQILTGSTDRQIRIFNPTATSAKSKLIQTYSAHGYEVLDIAVAEGNDRFVSVGGDKTVFLWDVATAQTLRRFGGHLARVNACAFGGEGDCVVISGELHVSGERLSCGEGSRKSFDRVAERDGLHG